MAELSDEIFAVLKMELSAHFRRAVWLARQGDMVRANDELSRAILCICRAREALRGGG
jgi:hypothetical protein